MDNFDWHDRLIFLQQLIHGDHEIAAGKWLEIIERDQSIRSFDEENHFMDMRNIIKKVKVEDDAKKSFDQLCLMNFGFIHL